MCKWGFGDGRDKWGRGKCRVEGRLAILFLDLYYWWGPGSSSGITGGSSSGITGGSSSGITGGMTWGRFRWRGGSRGSCGGRGPLLPSFSFA